MRRLVILEVQILFTGFRPVRVVALIAVTDVGAPGIDFIEAIPAARGDEEVAERTGLYRAVLVVFRETALALPDMPSARRIIDKAPSAEFDETVRPPGCIFHHQERSLDRQIGSHGPGHDGSEGRQQRRNGTRKKYSRKRFHLQAPWAVSSNRRRRSSGCEMITCAAELPMDCWCRAPACGSCCRRVR